MSLRAETYMSIASDIEDHADNLTGLPDGWSLYRVIELLRSKASRLEELADEVENACDTLDDAASAASRHAGDFRSELAQVDGEPDEDVEDVIATYQSDLPLDVEDVESAAGDLADILDEVANFTDGVASSFSSTVDVEAIAKSIKDEARAASRAASNL